MTVGFLRFMCFTRNSFAPFSVIRRRLDVFKTTIKIGCLLIEEFETFMIGKKHAQGMMTVNNVYTAIMELDESSVKPITKLDEGIVSYNNRKFTWKDIKEAEEYIFQEFNSLLENLQSHVLVPSLSGFYKSYVLANENLNGLKKGPGQKGHCSLADVFGREKDLKVFTLMSMPVKTYKQPLVVSINYLNWFHL